MSNLHSFARALPKAELHLHLEGTLEPDQMFALAQRNGVDIPYSSVAEIKAAYRFSNLQAFLDVYYAGMSVLRTEQDYYDLTFAYLERARTDCVRHAELFFDPQGHTARGIPFSVPISGIAAALEDGQKKLGVSSRLIMCFLRHLSEEAAFTTLEQAKNHLALIDGVGLDSSEIGHPPAKFQRVFQAAGQLGLKRVAHAGEEGPPEYVTQALDLLEIDRLDHGNRATENPALINRLGTAQIPLTLCPLSNLKLCVIGDMGEHPLADMLEAGLRVTVNSDDPSYFGGYLNDNYIALIDALGLSRSQLIQLAKNSFEASFLGDGEKAVHLAEIDKYVE